MKKRMAIALCAALALLLTGCRAWGSSTSDYPAAIMANGRIYLKSETTVPDEAAESAVIGYTSSYTDAFPEKDGETNFSREPGMPFAEVDGGLAVFCGDAWYLCVPKD